DEAFGGRVPFQPAMIPISQVAQVANRDGSASDFNITNRTLAAPHAIQEIFPVIVALVEPNSISRERFLADRFWGRLKLATVYKDFTLGADEQHAAAVAVEHLHAIRIEVTQSFSGFGILWWDDLNRTAVIHSQAPLRNIEMMRTPIRHHPPGILTVI